tara:strand:- start:110 stop:520 length:411 start_codon:yes stop_codon:yes gene_type:complete
MDPTGYYAGIRPLPGARELTYFDLSTSGPTSEKHQNNIRDPVPGIFTPLPLHPDQFSAAIMQNPMHSVLPCKGQPEAVRFGRFASSLTGGMYTNTGYARHQKLGLATNHAMRLDGAIMPIAGSFDPGALNTLGTVK